MPCVLRELFHGRNATNCQIIAKNYKLHLPTAISITLLNGLLPLFHGLRLSQSETVIPFMLFKRNMLLLFIADRYFTTFPALQLDEDQTSSIVNFLRAIT